MSGFFNETNYGRINKMCELLEGPMMKSAKSNKATQEQWAEMLGPLQAFIDEVAGTARAQPEQEEKPETPLRGSGGSKHPPRSPQALLEGLTPEQMLNVAYVALMKIDEDMYESSLKRG